MFKYANTPVGKFRFVAFLEGISLIVLLLICMPLKYVMGMPLFVRVVGSIHGALFVIYFVMTWQLAEDLKWKFSAITWKVLLASFIPFGTFYIDKKVLEKLDCK